MPPFPGGRYPLPGMPPSRYPPPGLGGSRGPNHRDRRDERCAPMSVYLTLLTQLQFYLLLATRYPYGGGGYAPPYDRDSRRSSDENTGRPDGAEGLEAEDGRELSPRVRAFSKEILLFLRCDANSTDHRKERGGRGRKNMSGIGTEIIGKGKEKKGAGKGNLNGKWSAAAVDTQVEATGRRNVAATTQNPLTGRRKGTQEKEKGAGKVKTRTAAESDVQSQLAARSLRVVVLMMTQHVRGEGEENDQSGVCLQKKKTIIESLDWLLYRCQCPTPIPGSPL